MLMLFWSGWGRHAMQLGGFHILQPNSSPFGWLAHCSLTPFSHAYPYISASICLLFFLLHASTASSSFVSYSTLCLRLQDLYKYLKSAARCSIEARRARDISSLLSLHLIYKSEKKRSSRRPTPTVPVPHTHTLGQREPLIPRPARFVSTSSSKTPPRVLSARTFAVKFRINSDKPSSSVQKSPGDYHVSPG
ncbi:uncharacterized protein BDZ83DRAFT_270666 [Colletotrichum acutatum]|uniref:Uncharacterized protein n=1 Tax=Glomerella acutata TaxID=27357 RepID=A0AAD8ULH2_GLOAC|nr:uncharacterized protein BDZ83DRAFT_270666 [Colletotrichum acutatum]KAK1726051.1 hypothetical protein BDZ83DRAFT_270666 [Colletotrichum acutatum]